MIARAVAVARDAGRRLARHPVVTSITPIGWALLAGGAVSAWVGWNRGWLEFRALAIMAAVVLAIAALSILRRREHDVLLELHRPRVQAGEEALGRVLVTAGGGKSSGPTVMELPVGKVVASFRVGGLAPGDEHEEMFTIPARRRGIVPLGPVRSVQADPIGAVSRNKPLTKPLELYIHPRIAHVEAGAIGMLKDVEGITTTNLSSSDVSFHALREYTPGDDRRAVHWRTTARTGRLMVRQFEETLRAHLVIVLSTLESDYATPDDFELAVSTAGSLGVSALGEDRQVTVLTSTEELRFPHALGLLDRLSGVELGAKGKTHRDLAVKAAGVPGISVAAFVTGDSAPAALRGAQLALSPSVYAFAVRCGAELSLARRRVGDLIVLDVSTLNQLPVAVRSLR
ncbi:MAG TPA: DUF58 domain-containing protein [Arachnia sp.]|nr:DUF58 domain-containing protein [Arachnia sp.]HMT85906.1 DUF58 domain-containing protein [Arachnia sp.]